MTFQVLNPTDDNYCLLSTTPSISLPAPIKNEDQRNLYMNILSYNSRDPLHSFACRPLQTKSVALRRHSPTHDVTSLVKANSVPGYTFYAAGGTMW